MIEDLRQEQTGVTDAAPIAFFYCSRDAGDSQRADPEHIIRSLLKQVATKTSKDPIAGAVVNAYKMKKVEENTASPGPLELEEAKELLLEFLESNPATLVIDGLDECDPKTRYNLLSALNEIITNAASLVRVFVSSRDDGDIVCQLDDCPNIYIRASDNESDIINFVEHQVSTAIKHKRIARGKVSSEMQQSIVATLTEGAQGMCVFDCLSLLT